MTQTSYGPAETLPLLKSRTKVCLTKAAHFGLSFSPHKSELLHCIPESSRLKSQNLDFHPPLRIETLSLSFTINPSRTIKLGVIIDVSLMMNLSMRKTCCITRSSKPMSTSLPSSSRSRYLSPYFLAPYTNRNLTSY
jgi:hypothetical protein